MKIEISGFPNCTDGSADRTMRNACAAIQDAFVNLTDLIDERDARIAELEKDLAAALEGKEA